jgi:hypothetical protein
VTPDGFAVNTGQLPYQPSASAGTRRGSHSPPGQRLNASAAQRAATIGDTLSARGSWAWYAGGWKLALADGARRRKAP